MLFVTGPGKTSIENHFDLNAELISHPARDRQGRAARESSSSSARAVEYFYTRQRRQLGLGPRGALRPRRSSATSRSSSPWATRSSACTPHRTSCARMVEEFRRGAGGRGDRVRGGAAAEEVVHYGIAKPARRPGDVVRAGGHRREARARRGAERPGGGRPLRVPPGASSTLLATTPPGKGGEIQLTDAIRALIREGGKVLRRAAGRRTSAATTSATSRATSAPSCEFALADPRTARSCAPTCARPGALLTPPSPPSMLILIRKRAFARAGLVGNPSDGYHGKTISLIVRNFHAEVVLYEWDDVEIVLAERGPQPLPLGPRPGPRREAARLLRRHPAGQGDDQEVRRVLRGAGHHAARPQLLRPLPDAPSRGRWAWPARARSSSPRCAA